LKEFIDSSWQQKKSMEINELLLDSKFLHLYAAPIFQPGQSEPLGAVVLLEDVTEEKVMMRSKDEFFSIASHELRTPLTAIRGNTAMIKSYYPEILKDESLKEIIDDIHSSSIRLIEIVNDFLDASRLEQGKMEFNLEPIDIAPVIKSVVDEMAQVGNEKGIYIKTEIEADKYPLVMTDKDRIKQVVYNLIGNAMKFTEEGGITLRVEPSSGFIKILVEDTGRGIPADKQSLLFRKFQQAGNSLITRDTTRGTGLGLYISKLLAEKMGGKINLEHSEEGKGSVFSFTIPIANGEASTNDTQT
jgi:signal transduction histidine kinase